MLILFAWTAFTIGACDSTPSDLTIPSKNRSIKQEHRDTTKNTLPSPIFKSEVPRVTPGFRPFTTARGIWTPELQHRFSDSLDSILQLLPELRNPLLKELLVPSSRGTSNDIFIVSQSSTNSELERASEFMPFEVMSLIAKGHDDGHPPDKTLKAYQLEIIRTMHWLNELFRWEYPEFP